MTPDPPTPTKPDPLKHISFSRMSLFFQSEPAFKSKYVLGEPDRFFSKYMRYGNRINDILNGEVEPLTDGEKKLKPYDLIDGGVSERKLLGQIDVDGQSYDLIGFVDREYSDYSIEVKTGKTDNAYRNARNQLIFYDLIRKYAWTTKGSELQMKGYVWWIPTYERPDGYLNAKGEKIIMEQFWDHRAMKTMESRVELFVRQVKRMYG